MRLKYLGLTAIIGITLSLSACYNSEPSKTDHKNDYNSNGEVKMDKKDKKKSKLAMQIDVIDTPSKMGHCMAKYQNVFLLLDENKMTLYKADKGIMMRQEITRDSYECKSETIANILQNAEADSKFGVRAFDATLAKQLKAQATPGQMHVFARSFFGYSPLEDATTKVGTISSNISIRSMLQALHEADPNKVKKTKGVSESLKEDEVKRKLAKKSEKGDRVCTINNQIGKIRARSKDGKEVQVLLEGYLMDKPKGYLFEKSQGDFVVFRTYERPWFYNNEVAKCEIADKYD